MSWNVLDAAQWKGITDAWVLDAALWKHVTGGWVLDGAQWKQFLAASPPPDLGVPSGLGAVAQPACVSGAPRYRAHLTWTNANSTYQVRVRRNGVLIATLAVGTTSYDDDGNAANTTPSFTVAHYDPATNSEGAASAPASCAFGINPCLAVPGISVANQSACVGGSSSYKARVTVTGNSAFGHKIYRDGVLVQTLAAGVSTWDDTGIAAGTYSYTATEYDASGETAESAPFGVSVGDPCAPPNSPASCNATADSFCDGLGNAQYQILVTVTGGGPQYRYYVDGVLNATGGSGEDLVVDTGGNHTVDVYSYDPVTGFQSTGFVEDTVFLADPCV